MSDTLAYYPGCSLHSSAREYDMSCRAVLSQLGISFVEVEDWNCCGASSAHSVSDELGVALPLRNLAIAEAMNVTGVFTPCAACYARLRHAEHEVRTDAGVRERMAELIGVPWQNTLTVFHVLDVFTRIIGTEKLKSITASPLNGLKIASYYGCLLVRPPRIATVDPRFEAPTVMDEIVEAIGAEPVSWPHKTECCGAAAVMPHTDSVLRLVHRLVTSAQAAGANCLAVACPLCHANLDMRQKKAARQFGMDHLLPVFYITQLVGLALGLNQQALGLDRHLVDTAAVLAAGARQRKRG